MASDARSSGYVLSRLGVTMPANKDEILDGIVDIVFSELDLTLGRRALAPGDPSTRRLGTGRAAASSLGACTQSSTQPRGHDDYVLAHGAPLDLSGELTCDWRDGDVW